MESRLTTTPKIKKKEHMIQQLQFWVYAPDIKQGLEEICMPICIGILVTITKLWKQPKCLWTDEWINMEYQP